MVFAAGVVKMDKKVQQRLIRNLSTWSHRGCDRWGGAGKRRRDCMSHAKQTDRQTDRQTDTDRHRQTHTHTHTHTHTLTFKHNVHRPEAGELKLRSLDRVVSFPSGASQRLSVIATADATEEQSASMLNAVSLVICDIFCCW